MHEDPFDDGTDEPGRPDATGVTRVDAVLDAVVTLSDRPLAEHVAVFERAHDELRRSLDDLDAGRGEDSP